MNGVTKMIKFLESELRKKNLTQMTVSSPEDPEKKRIARLELNVK